MPLPPDHEQRGARSLSGRERGLIRGIAVLAAVLVLAVGVSLLVSGRGSGHGCVRATIAGPVGAEQIDRCGAGARQLCRGLGPGQGLSAQAVEAVAAECRKAGLGVDR